MIVKSVFRFLVFVVVTAMLVMASHWYYFVGADTSRDAEDVNYMIQLGLMKGHLLVGKELLDGGYRQQAEVHLGQPVAEIYADLEGEFAERNVLGFKTTLEDLQALVRTGASGENVESEFEMAMKKIDRAIAVLPFGQRLRPQFLLQVVNGLLKAAEVEYKAAIANGKIVAAIDYQASRGFVTYAETLYNWLPEQMATTYPDIHGTIIASIRELKTAWPSAIAPGRPTMTPERVSQLIKTIRESSQKVVTQISS